MRKIIYYLRLSIFAFINKEAEKISLLKEWYLLSDCEQSISGPQYFQRSFNWMCDVNCIELYVNRVSHCFTLYCSAVHKCDY